MRITNNMLISNMVRYIGNNLFRMEKYQRQLATGKKIQYPSDDPIVASRALKLRTDVSEIEQFQRNVEDAMSWMEYTEKALESIGDVLQRARELAVQGANGTYSAEETQKIMDEIEQLKNHIIHTANAAYAGRYIFSGFQTDKRLMNDDGTFAIEVSNSEEIKFEVGIGDSINVNVLGGDLFNSGADVGAGEVGTAPPGSMIDVFNRLIAGLQSGDNTAVGDLLNEIDEQFNNVMRVRADVGARLNRLELTSNRLENDYLNFSKLMSKNEDADLAETIINLKNEENVYRASLAGGARIIQPTLIDFLR